MEKDKSQRVNVGASIFYRPTKILSLFKQFSSPRVKKYRVNFINGLLSTQTKILA